MFRETWSPSLLKPMASIPKQRVYDIRAMIFGAIVFGTSDFAGTGTRMIDAENEDPRRVSHNMSQVSRL